MSPRTRLNPNGADELVPLLETMEEVYVRRSPEADARIQEAAMEAFRRRRRRIRWRPAVIVTAVAYFGVGQLWGPTGFINVFGLTFVFVAYFGIVKVVLKTDDLP